MKKLLFFFLVLSLSSAAQAADSFSTLEERMSGKEFKETGLGKLTDEELAALNDWLRGHSVATLENATAPRSTAGAAVASTSSGTAEDMRGFENQPKSTKKETKEDKVIHSSIVGTFDGWKAKGTLFKLANGMIWQQTETDVFYTKPVVNPEVELTKGFMGNWRLKLVEHNSSVRVKRIQ